MRFNKDLAVSEELAKKYEEVLALLNQLPGSREKSLAITNLEQSALWAGVAERISKKGEE